MGKIIEDKIVKRTFEGEFDEKKNNCPSTSKYRKSLKYTAFLKIQYSHGGIAETTKSFRTKKEAIQYIENNS